MTQVTARSEGRPDAEENTYLLEGTLLEACSCNVLCPCWIGEDPDGGSCDSYNAYHITNGQINGVDVSGLDIIKVARIPGNVLKEQTWICVYLVDERATPQQKQLLLDAFNGKLGGPMADLAGVMLLLELHVGAAVLWAGGLVAVMTLVTHPAVLAQALPRFSKLAAVAIFLTAVTGALNAGLDLSSDPRTPWQVALFSTGYGYILLLKSGCILAVAALGAHIRYRLLPGIRRGQTTQVVAWATAELAVMGLAFGLAVVLTRFL